MPEEVIFLQPMIPLKRLDIFPPDWEMLRRSRRVHFFFYTHTYHIHFMYFVLANTGASLLRLSGALYGVK